MVGEYHSMLAKGAGTMISQEGYGAAFHAKEYLSNRDSLTETIVKYTKRASLVESKVSNLEERLATLNTGSNTPPP